MLNKILLSFAVLLFITSVIFVYYFPLGLLNLNVKWTLKKAGVVEQNLDGIHTYTNQHCEQQPCVCIGLIHGLGDEGLTWKKILEWPESRWQQMGLVKPYLLYAVDLPGSGESLPLTASTDYQARKQARLIATLLKKKCSQWILVGNSMGGWISSWIALDEPELVSRLLLLSPSGWNQKAFIKKENLVTEEGLREFQRKAYAAPREISSWIWKAIVRKASQSEITRILNAQISDDYLELNLPLVRMPTLLFWGKEDQIFPLSVGYEMRDQIPGVIWREAQKCGHLPQKECPFAVIQSIIDLVNYGSI